MEEKMRKLLMIGLAWLVMVAWVAPALADVNVYADITKEKDVTVIEDLTITKTVTINVTVAAPDTETAAEANALVNQVATLERALGNDGGGPDADQMPVIQEVPGTENVRWNTIQDSILFNVGIVGVNQDSGNMNNQANAIAVAVVDVTGVGAFANPQAAAEQINTFNFVWEVDPTIVLRKADYLINSVNNNTGIVGVNQSVGNMNNQGNAVAVAAGLVLTGDVGGVVIALAEADLGQVNAENIVLEQASQKLDWIQGSINNNHGITSVNQSAGNMNNQGNVVAISFTH
jgi:hypothetical protein